MATTRVESRGYSTASRLLHWLTAIVVVATIPVGQYMQTEGLARPVQDTLYIFHKNVGVLILLLVLARLAVRAAAPPPPFPPKMPEWKQRIAALTHGALYLLLIVMAVSGYTRVRAGGFPVEALDALGVPPLVPRSEPLEETAQAVHHWTRIVLIVVIVTHVGAAIHHGAVLRDGVFRRMWPPVRS